MSVLVDQNTKVICQGLPANREHFILNKQSTMVLKWWEALRQVEEEKLIYLCLFLIQSLRQCR